METANNYLKKNINVKEFNKAINNKFNALGSINDTNVINIETIKEHIDDKCIRNLYDIQ